MTFSIEQFKSAIGRRGGLMRDNRYVLSMSIPNIMRTSPTLPPDAQIDVSGVVRDMEFWADSITIPGYQLGVNAVKRWTYGPDEKRPFTPLYFPFVVTFNSDMNGDYIQFFNNWLQYIMPHDWYNDTINQRSNFNGRQYEVEYKSNYAVDIQIATVDTSGEITKLYFIKEAFPSAITDIPMSYSSAGQHAKFQVMIEYLDWTTTTQTPAVIL